MQKIIEKFSQFRKISSNLKSVHKLIEVCDKFLAKDIEKRPKTILSRGGGGGVKRAAKFPIFPWLSSFLFRFFWRGIFREGLGRLWGEFPPPRVKKGPSSDGIQGVKPPSPMPMCETIRRQNGKRVCSEELWHALTKRTRHVPVNGIEELRDHVEHGSDEVVVRHEVEGRDRRHHSTIACTRKEDNIFIKFYIIAHCLTLNTQISGEIKAQMRLFKSNNINRLIGLIEQSIIDFLKEIRLGTEKKG